MTDTSKYTIEERIIVTVWVHERERTGDTYEEIRENFFLHFNKAAPSEANLQEFPTHNVYVYLGLRAHQHLRSLAPVMK